MNLIQGAAPVRANPRPRGGPRLGEALEARPTRLPHSVCSLEHGVGTARRGDGSATPAIGTSLRPCHIPRAMCRRDVLNPAALGRPFTSPRRQQCCSSASNGGLKLFCIFFLLLLFCDAPPDFRVAARDSNASYESVVASA